MSTVEPSPPPHGRIRGYVVAGGRSSRMGRDKAFLPWNGITLLDHAIHTLRAATSDVAILCGPARRYEDFGVPVVVDEICGAGPIGGLYSALTHAASSGRDRMVWLAVDTPHVSSALLRELAQALDEADVAMARTDRGVEPLCAAFRVEPCLGSVRRAIIERRLKLTDAFASLSAAHVDAPPGSLLNLNSPADLEQAQAD
ncbi:MAG: molybdenum cofactor guanylyltransferase [Vicinamibacteria bacterium]